MSKSESYQDFLQTEVTLEDYSVVVRELEMNTPFNLPFGTINTRPSVWLQTSGTVDGERTAYGAAEGTSLPMQIPLYDDFSDNLEKNVHALTDNLVGHPLTVAQAAQRVREQDLGGNFATARMTVETALIDLAARGVDKSVFEIVSGEALTEPIGIPYGKSIAENDFDELVLAGHTAVARGAGRLKFKLSPTNHEAVIRGITELKQAYPDTDFMVDANGMFNPEDKQHIDILRIVDGLGLLMIEEPVSRAKDSEVRGLPAHRLLRDVLQLETSICLDDSVTTSEDAQTAIREGLAEIVNIKPGRIGSFITSLEIVSLAKESDKQVMVGGMLEATPGRTMTLTLAALCLRQGFNIPGDVSLPQERLLEDLLPEEEQLRLDEQGNVVFNPGIGWGYRL